MPVEDLTLEVVGTDPQKKKRSKSPTGEMVRRPDGSWGPTEEPNQDDADRRSETQGAQA